MFGGWSWGGAIIHNRLALLLLSPVRKSVKKFEASCTVLVYSGFATAMDRIHKRRPINYCFVFVLMVPNSLALKQHFFCILSMQTRLVGLLAQGQRNNLLTAIYEYGLLMVISAYRPLHSFTVSGKNELRIHPLKPRRLETLFLSCNCSERTFWCFLWIDQRRSPMSAKVG